MSASPPRLPGAAEPTWLARPTRSPERSLPNLPTSSPQSPGGTSPTAASLGARSPGRLARRLPASRTPADRCPIRRLADHPSLRSRFRLVNPVGPSRPVVAAVVAHRGSPRTSRPFLGLRSACAVRCEAHTAPCVSPGQAVFFKSQGYPPHFPVVPRTSSVVHLSSTPLCTCECTGEGSSGHARWPRSCRSLDDPADIGGPAGLTFRAHADTITHMTSHLAALRLADIIIIR